MAALLNHIRGVSKDVLLVCLLCCRAVRKPHYLPCSHLFCAECLEEYCNVPSIVATLSSAAGFGILEYCCPICLKTWSSKDKMPKQPKQIKKLLDSVSLSTKKCKGERHSEWKCSKHSKPVSYMCNVCHVLCCQECCHENHEQPINDDDAYRVNRTKTASSEASQLLSTVLKDLVDSLNQRECTLAQVRRLRNEQEMDAMAARAAMQLHTQHVIEQAKMQEAAMLCAIDKHKELVKKQSDILENLCGYHVRSIEHLINYVHNLLSKPLANSAPILVNHTIVNERSCLLRMPTDPQMTEHQCVTALMRHPVFDKKTVSIKLQNYKRMPAVSYIERTLENILESSYCLKECDNKHKKQNTPKTKSKEEAHSMCMVNGTNFTQLREKPKKLVEVYSPLSQNTEPTSAVYLPDGRLVVAERKGQKLAVWEKGCKEKDYDIKCDGKIDPITQAPDHIQPYVLCYWEEHDFLLYTDKRHFTIGLVSSDGDNMDSLKYELIKDPFGLDVLKTGHLVSTDTHFQSKSIYIIDPNTSVIVRSVTCKKVPTWVTVLRDGTFVVTQEHELHLYDKNGDYIDRLGSRQQLMLQDAGQVVQDANDCLLIADGANRRVLMYDARKSCTMTSSRTAISQVDWPRALALYRDTGELTMIQGTGIVCTYDMYQTS